MATFYRDWAPTAHDVPGLNLPDRQHWLVAPVTRTRDSGCLGRSNFVAALKQLGGESETVEVHLFNHWACGWFEIILVDPAHAETIEKIENSLSDNRVLDEDHYINLELTEATAAWADYSIKMRVKLCQLYELCIFAARHSSIPEGMPMEALIEE